MRKTLRLNLIPGGKRPTVGPLRFHDANTVEVPSLGTRFDIAGIADETTINGYVLRKLASGVIIVDGPKATCYLRFEELYGCWYYGKVNKPNGAGQPMSET
jgi:hypothetical protein